MNETEKVFQARARSLTRARPDEGRRSRQGGNAAAHTGLRSNRGERAKTQPLRRSSKQVYAPNALRQKTKLRVDEAATLLDVHEDTVRRWLAEGKLASIRTPGGHWRVRAESLKHFPVSAEVENER